VVDCLWSGVFIGVYRVFLFFFSRFTFHGESVGEIWWFVVDDLDWCDTRLD
jgi:hypothetical protein